MLLCRPSSCTGLPELVACTGPRAAERELNAWTYSNGPAYNARPMPN